MRALLVTSLVLVSGACATSRNPAPSAQTPPLAAAESVAVDLAHVSCARAGRGALPQRLPEARQGSAVALARSKEGALYAYVADADSRSIHTVSVDAKHELGRTRITGTPRQIVVLPDGRLVVAVSDAARIVVLEPMPDPTQPLAKLCEREVPAEPWGLALSPEDARLVVTSGWDSALTVVDAASFAVERVVPLPRDPRAVVVDRDNRAFVSHLVGAKMSVVDLGSASASSDAQVIDLSVQKSTPAAQLVDKIARRTGAQGYALAKVGLPSKVAGALDSERILAPMVSVDPGDAARQRAVYYGPVFDGVAKETPFVGVVDPAAKVALGKYLLGTTDDHFARECLLPRAAAVRPKTGTLLVACLGIDALLELDALAVDPFRSERRRFALAPGPEGMAVDDASGRAVVFSQMGGALEIVALDDRAAAVARVDLDYHPDPALVEVAKGRQLFYRTDDVRIASDGLGCSSCHLDGRDDAVTWTTPEGARQTPMLAGRVAGTAPYGWEGNRASLHDYIAHTVINLGGTGLPDDQLEELSKFLQTVQGPPRATRLAAHDRQRILRGAELFESAEQGCSGCHGGPASTDAMTHDMEQRKAPVDTPSLRFVRGTAPYFHDGRYSTLEALLGDLSSPMGHSSQLPEEDRAALAAYLRTL